MTAFLQLWSDSISQAAVSEGTLWEDPDFPGDPRYLREHMLVFSCLTPSSETIPTYQKLSWGYRSALSLVAGTVPPGIPPGEAVRWLRPSEVAGGEAVLFVGDVPGDGPMVPGQWLLSAIGILTGRPHLLRSLFVPTGQEALGRYCVRLFKEANWINVFVDTCIACNALGDVRDHDGTRGHRSFAGPAVSARHLDEPRMFNPGHIHARSWIRPPAKEKPLAEPLFCRGEERHELWGFLLEKAYAKAHGCYENLMHGDTREALRDLTGGVSEKLQWQLSGRPGAAGVSAATPGQAAPEQQREIPRPRVAGWGILAGTTPPLGWVFENIRDRLSDGQVLGCRVMKGLCSGVSYCVLEAFEKGGTRLLRLRDPWADAQAHRTSPPPAHPHVAENKARQRGAEPGEYLGDWGPSSRQWSARAVASELLPRTLRGMFWMEMGDFLRMFNTLYAVDLAGGVENEQQRYQQPSFATIHRPWRGLRTCGRRWIEGRALPGVVGGRRVWGKIGPRDSSIRNNSGGTTTTSGFGITTATGAVAPSSGTPKSAYNKDNTAQVLITVTQEDSRYHRKDYTERGERRRSIGFLVHSHRWSTDSKRDIPKLSKIVQAETKHLTRPFVPRRDVSCRLALPQGQYVIVATSLEAGVAGRFWVHVKADRDFALQPSFPGAANAGSNAGSCGIKTREVGVSVEIAYNEVEENAEGNGLTAAAASLGGLLTTAQELAARKAAAEHQHQMLQEQAERKENQDTTRAADTIVAEDGDN
ncbi:unnamed protein product [Ectocarpus sp. CCAP 1310/34]|nr:unnamed protein product [Ectocarpus sp. CCAP 1310/34]